MAFFEKIIGKQKDIVDSKEVDMPVFYVAESKDKMEQSFEMARATFGYFWREMFWGIPVLDIACVKVLFTQEINGKEYGEHMWINDIDFDGEFITGTLVNGPNDLINIKNGDSVKVRIGEISDWMFACEGKAYGA
ncbi:MULTISPECIES: YegJ family protein [unclassified Campylobacter]|uniref:YegJ family protein n=1 Tax=unclassified Campylobacter TaxID=2593542 RepID=UPI003D358251